jgi:hypothetical protein
MRARSDFLRPSDGQVAGIEVNLIPLQVNQLVCPQAITPTQGVNGRTDRWSG